jgi:hypothetical protein
MSFLVIKGKDNPPPSGNLFLDIIFMDRLKNYFKFLFKSVECINILYYEF